MREEPKQNETLMGDYTGEAHCDKFLIAFPSLAVFVVCLAAVLSIVSDFFQLMVYGQISKRMHIDLFTCLMYFLLLITFILK